jgi:hypothetical protein
VSVDGASFTTATYVGTPAGGGGAFAIGARVGVTDMYLTGRLDNVCFGKSVVGGFATITPTAIRDALYSAGAGTTYAALSSTQKTNWGLISFWEFDSGLTVDSHGTNTLTNNGATITGGKVVGSTVDLKTNSGLVSWWDLDESVGNRYDAHGTNHLTSNNSVGVAAGIVAGNALTEGIPGKAASFASASSQSLSVTDNASVSVSDIDFWWAGWTNFTTSGVLQTVFAKGISNTNSTEYALYRWSDDKFYWHVSNNITSAEIGTGATVGSGWHFFMCWHDSVNNTLNVQVDNGTVYSTSYSSGSYDGANTLYLGWDTSGGGTRYLNGALDSVAFGKSPAAGIAPIASSLATSLYNSGRGRSYAALSNLTLSPAGAANFVSANSQKLTSTLAATVSQSTDQWAACWVVPANTGSTQYFMVTPFCRGLVLSTSLYVYNFAINNAVGSLGTLAVGVPFFLFTYHDSTNGNLYGSMNGGAFSFIANAGGASDKIHFGFRGDVQYFDGKVDSAAYGKAPYWWYRFSCLIYPRQPLQCWHG